MGKKGLLNLETFIFYKPQQICFEIFFNRAGPTFFQNLLYFNAVFVKEFSLTLATQQNLINASADASVLT